MTNIPALTASYAVRPLPMSVTRSPASFTLVASSMSNTRDRSRSMASTLRSPDCGSDASSRTSAGAAIWSAITSSVRSVMNGRAASTDRPLGPCQRSFSKNVTRRRVAIDSAPEDATNWRMAAPSKPTLMPMRPTPRLSSSPSVRSSRLHRPTVVRQFGTAGSPMLIPLPAARMSAREITVATELSCPPGLRHGILEARACAHGPRGADPQGSAVITLAAAAGDGGERVRKLAQRLSPEGQQVDRIFGLDVDVVAAGVAQHAPDRRRDHAVAVRVAKDDHAATDARVADQVSRVGPSHAERSALTAVVANLSGSYADHEIPI